MDILLIIKNVLIFCFILPFVIYMYILFRLSRDNSIPFLKVFFSIDADSLKRFLSASEFRFVRILSIIGGVSFLAFLVIDIFLT